MKLLIIYQPGFGGNFLAHLFSLDLSTVPYCHAEQSTYPLTVNDRLQIYKFNQLTDDRSKIHDYISRNNDYCTNWHNKMILSKKLDEQIHTVMAWHPSQTFLDAPAGSLGQYIIPELSYNNFSNFWLVYSKQQWGGFPALSKEGFEIENKITATHPHVSISVDAFLNVDTWEAEYKRINDIVGLPNQLDAASVLYKAWYDNRVAPIKDKFNSITNHDKYLTLRRWAEDNGEIHWRRFYNEVREGSTWPECNFEEEFYQLPDHIQHDLVNIHGYNPKPLL